MQVKELLELKEILYFLNQKICNIQSHLCDSTNVDNESYKVMVDSHKNITNRIDKLGR